MSCDLAAESRLRELEAEKERLDKELQKARDKIIMAEFNMNTLDNNSKVRVSM